MNRNVQVGTFACNFALCIEAPQTAQTNFELHTLRMSKRLEAVWELLLQVLLHSDKLEGCQAQVNQQENRLACGIAELKTSIGAKVYGWLSWDTHSSMISISSIFKLKLEIFAKKELLVQVPESSRWWTAGCHTQLWRQSVPIQAWILCLYESINIFRIVW